MIINITTKKGVTINTLTSKCVIDLHDLLTTNAELIGADPVEPKGVKDHNALERAVSRQTTGIDDYYKYDSVFLNCATLVYGINKNHVFHNGNKRASFLAMIKHLYVNGYVLKPHVSHKDIYNLILAIASKDGSIREYARHFAVGKRDKSKNNFNYIDKGVKQKGTKDKIWSPEEEITYISLWLQDAVISKNVHPKFRMKLSDLKKIIECKGFFLEYINGGQIRIYCKEVKKTFLGLSTKTIIVNERRYNLGNSKLSEVKKEIIDSIRQDFNLKISDGFDNVIFYDDENFVDEQLTIFKGLIYRLSKT